MAIQYAPWRSPTGYRNNSQAVERFAQGYGLTKGIRDEQEAVAALEAYADTLYAPGAKKAAVPVSAGGIPATRNAGLDAIMELAGLSGGSPVNDRHALVETVKAPADLTAALAAKFGGGTPAPAPRDDRVLVADASPDMSSYFASVAQAESGGNPNAANPASSSRGLYGFTSPTWNGLVQKYPQSGLRADGRGDPAQEEIGIRLLTNENMAALRGAGVPVNPTSLYAAHFLGSGAAPKVLAADPSTPMTALVGGDVIASNPHLAEMTAGDFAQWAQRKGTNGKGGFSPVSLTDGAWPQPMGPQVELPPKEVLVGLLRNPQTRELGAALIAQSQKGQMADRYQTFTGPDGNTYQMNVSSGEIGALTKSSATEAPADVREYEWYAKQEQAAGREPMPYLAFKQAQKTKDGFGLTVGPDGTVTVQQGDITMPKLTEGQSKDVGFVTRASGALPTLDTIGDRLTSFGEDLVGNVPYGEYLQSEDYQMADQAGKEFLTAFLRKDSGAAITPDELTTYGSMFLPRPGDKPGVLAKKKESRDRAINGIALGIPPEALKVMIEAGVEIPAMPGKVTETPATPTSSALPAGITEEDIQFTMEKHGVTREQVLERLNAS